MRKRATQILGVLLSLLLLGVIPAGASGGPKWSDRELVRFSEIILTGRVARVTAGWDDSRTLYTYVVLEVAQVLKGWVPDRQIVLKQIGGRVEDLGLVVPGQASFSPGEDVLVFLEVRPRDSTLYTTALWQGKWTLRTAPASAERQAMRYDPASAARGSLGTLTAAKALEQFLGQIWALGGDESRRASGRAFNFWPLETPSDAQDTPVSSSVLSGRPRWHEADDGLAIPVDIQSGGQSGLAGGGTDEILRAMGQWSEAGSSFRYSFGGTTATGCNSVYEGNGRVSISFTDPCGEISNTGGTVGVGGFYFNAHDTRAVNGVTFHGILQGFVINNDSATALEMLDNSGCFQEFQLAGLGKALGLSESPELDARMFPSLTVATCAAGARPLGANDVAGIRLIYPGSGVPPDTLPSKSTMADGVLDCVSASIIAGVTVMGELTDGDCEAPHRSPARADTYTFSGSAGTRVTIAMSAFDSNSGTLSDPYLYLVGPSGAVVASDDDSGSGFDALISDFSLSSSGRYTIEATSFRSSQRGSYTLRLDVSGGIGTPGAPTSLTVSVSGSTVTLTWTAPTTGGTPTTYIIQAGSSPGASNLANFTTGSTAGSFTATGVPNGTYYVRVLAQNSNGTSTPSNEVGLVVGGGGPCTVPPGPPTSLTYSLAGDLLSVFWNLPASGEPASSYIVQAGNTSGGVNLFNGNVGNVTSITNARVATGTYYVRVIAVNACGQSGPSNEVSFTVGAGHSLQFTAPGELRATVGQFFRYSFCQPAPIGSSDLCNHDPGNPNFNPSGGQPPYHFQLESGVGFPPIGINLLLNGNLEGTSVTERTRTFGVCAVDLAGTSVCRRVRMITTIESDIPGTYDGTYTAPRLSAVCPPTSGYWTATVTQTGNTLTLQWYDDYHQETLTVTTTLVGRTATWSVGSGDDRIDFTGTFGTGTVTGTFVGPLCTPAAGRYRGTFTGTKR